MTDVMIDLETFGNGKNAAVVQIGACYFNRDGDIGLSFKCNVDARSAAKSGADIDADTVYWWLAQSPEAIASITEPLLMEIRPAFLELNEFLSGAKNIWSHATFDFVIVMETMKRLNITPLFSFRAARDIRTLLELSGINPKDFKREGIHHDGLADAIFQVKYCVAAMKVLER